MGSIEYAVARLGCRILLILDHIECGAIDAACSNKKMPSRHLQHIVDEIRTVATLGPSLPGEVTTKTLRQAHIHHSAAKVLAESEILRKFRESGDLAIIEAEYELETGKVIRLQPSR